MLANYTYGQSLDDSSNLQEQVNPFNYRAEYGLSAFDIKHSFVVSYTYELPFPRLIHSASRLTQGCMKPFSKHALSNASEVV